MKTNIVMIAYGPETNSQQAIFCLSSLFRFSDAMAKINKILIYTDSPKVFDGFFTSDKIEIINITKEDIQRWRGPKDFVHRLKLEVLKEAHTLYPADNLFYVDSDTYFTSSPSQLFDLMDDDHSIMHIEEGNLKNTKDILHKKIYRFVKKHPLQVKNSKVAFQDTFSMWNAGVIGLSPSNFRLLDVMLNYADQAYDIYPKFVMEQWAVSLVLQNYTKITAAANEIYHYWNNKDAYNEEIQNYLRLNNKAELATEKLTDFSYPKEPPPKKSLLKRLLPF